MLLRPIFAPKIKTASPQRDRGAEIVRDLLLFVLERTQSCSGEVTEFWLRPFFFQILAGKTVSIMVKAFFLDQLILTKKPLQSDSIVMKIWVKFVYCSFHLSKKPIPLRNPGCAPVQDTVENRIHLVDGILCRPLWQ